MLKKLRAYCRLLRQKIIREKASVEYIARGWALGMFAGCFIPFGLQLIVSVPLAFKFNVSKIGATLGTFITNPVTIIFIYPAQCWVGSRILCHPLTWEKLSGTYFEQLSSVSLFSAEGWRTLGGIGAEVLGGFFAGGLLLALVMTPLTYFGVKRIVEEHRRRVESVKGKV